MEAKKLASFNTIENDLVLPEVTVTVVLNSTALIAASNSVSKAGPVKVSFPSETSQDVEIFGCVPVNVNTSPVLS